MRPSAPGLSLLPLEPQGEDGITIAEVGLRYLDHCQQYYRTPSGKVTSSVDGVQMALRALFPFANLPAARFGAKALKTVQAAMVAEGRPRVGVNRSIKAIRRFFRPERFVRGVPRPLRPAAEVWINPPEDRAIRRTIQLQRDTDFVTQVSQSH